MSTVARRLGLGALLMAGLWAYPSSAWAQGNLTPYPSVRQGGNINPQFLIPGGLSLNQYLALQAQQARTAAQIAPWLNNPGIVNPIVPPALTNPYLANPYSPFGVANPYAPVGD